jgi:hypothetical protein
MTIAQQKRTAGLADDGRKANRRKAIRTYEAIKRAKAELYDTMHTEDGHPLVPRLGVIADELDRIGEDLNDKYGVLYQVQIKDPTLFMFWQRAFLHPLEVSDWANGVVDEHATAAYPRNKFKIVTEDHPDFFVQVDA